MRTFDLLPVRSYELFMAAVISRPPDDMPTVLVNGQHNSVDQFFTRIGQTIALDADFDGTKHPGNQWGAVRRLMTPQNVAGEQADLEAYLARQAHDNIEDVAFILRSVERMRGISAQELHDLMPSLPPRPGAMELINGFNPANVAITSYGTHDFIREWLRCHRRKGLKDLSLVTIFALQLAWKRSPRGYVIDGCRPETVVTNGNKGYLRDLFCARRQINPSQLLVLGDAPTDVLMMAPQNVGVLIIPKVDPDPGRMKYRLEGLQALWPRVSAVLLTGQSGSLDPLVELRQLRRPIESGV